MAGDDYIPEIFVLDNKIRDSHGYINLLQSRARIKVINDLKDREEIYSTPAKVFIFAYTLGHLDGSGTYPCIDELLQKEDLEDGLITGLDIAESIRLAEEGKKSFIMIVSAHASNQKPPFSELEWDEWIEKGTIDCYCTRDPEKFVEHVGKILAAVEERK